MTLLEVNEALTISQESANDEANIIFGAVVDPSLTGKVKITVIATGFDRKGATRGIAPGALQTPFDLSTYTAHAGRGEAAVASAGHHQPHVPAQHAAMGQPGQYAAPSFTVNRRPPLDLSPMASHSGAAARAPEPVPVDSPLDVPAFLRRQG
jgi:cell division protein FtsZ